MLKIINARVYSNGQCIDRDVGVEDDTITSIGNVGEADETIDAKGQWLLPGLIDPHVHLREPGATHKEDFLTGTRAAVAGGFTTVIDMPNTNPPTTTRAALQEKQALAKKAAAEVFFHFGASESNFNEIKKARPASLKMYLDKTTGSLQINGWQIVARHFENFDKTKPIVLHAEGENIAKAMELARKCNRRIHLAHVPTADAVRQAKAWPKASVEITPHHLFLSEKYAWDNPDRGAVKPRLPSESERRQLWDVVEQVDCMGSDHAPHTLEEKAQGAYGFPGLETTLALMLKAYYEKRLSFSWIMERLAENPAKLFGLGKRGKTERGYVANLILVDPKKEWTVHGEELQTKCRWSPYEGWGLKGKPTWAMVRGKILYQDGEFL